MALCCASVGKRGWGMTDLVASGDDQKRAILWVFMHTVCVYSWKHVYGLFIQGSCTFILLIIQKEYLGYTFLMSTELPWVEIILSINWVNYSTQSPSASYQYIACDSSMNILIVLLNKHETAHDDRFHGNSISKPASGEPGTFSNFGKI